MKKIIITVFLVILCTTFCEAQSLQNAAKQKQEQAARQQQAAKEQKEREQQAIREQIEQQYRSIIASAERNFNQKQYEQAKQDYEAALKLKPENSVYTNQKIAEIDQIFKERDILYKNTIESAEKKLIQQQYEQAKQDYITARGYKPEHSDYINFQIAVIDDMLLEKEKQREKEELDRRYENTIASAERSFNQRKFAQAKQDYEAALKLKFENANFIYTKIAEIEREMNKPAILYIYRKRPKFLDGNIGSERHYDVFLDKVLIGRTEDRWKTSVIVKEFGTKTVSAANKRKNATVTVNFEPGGEYYVSASYTTASVGNIVEYTPILQVVDKSIGKAEYDAIKD